MNSSVSGPSKIRQQNRSAVLSHIRLNGKNSRLQIGKELGLSAAAITSVVNELIDERLLRKSAPEIGSNSKKLQGRPISMLELNPSKGYVFGIVLRPTAKKCIIESAWSDYTGLVHTQVSNLEVNKESYQDILDGISQVIKQLQNQIPTDNSVYGLSIGVPGVVENQRIPIAPKLSCIENPEFISALLANYDFPISFENDTNLGAMFELQNQPRLRRISFAYLHVYSGVGSSISLEGKLLKGRRGWAGEIGQLKIPSIQQQQTSFEQLLGVDEILGDLLEDINQERSDFDALVPYINNKNKKVLNTIDNYCESLFNVINILHNVIDLDEVMINFQSKLLLNILLPKIIEKTNTLKHPIEVTLPSDNVYAYVQGAALNALNLALDNIEKRKVKTKNS